jgi:hypothetical protein
MVPLSELIQAVYDKQTSKIRKVGEAMITYILQFCNDGKTRQNYVSDEKTNIEFLQLGHAQTVGMDLGSSGSPFFPCQKKNWRICDSHGNYYST